MIWVTWEILLGLITLFTFMMSLGGVLVRLAKTITSLECAVWELREFITKQGEENKHFRRELSSLREDMAVVRVRKREAGRNEISL